MKKEKLFVFLALALFMFSLFAGVVSAQSTTSSLNENIIRPVAEWFANLFGYGLTDQFNTSFVAILLFLLVFLIVYSVSTFLPFISERNWIAFSLSLIIAVLATFYLDSSYIKDILLSYKALGIALTSFVPFLVIAVIAYRTKLMGYTFGSILSKGLWIGFLIILAVLYFTGRANNEISEFGKFAYPLTALGVVIMLLIENWIYFKIYKNILKGEVGKAGDLYAAHLTAKMEKILDQLDTADPTTAKKLQEEYDGLEKKLGKSKPK